MKKVFFITLITVLLFSVNALAVDTALLDIHNKIFAEAKEIQSLLSDVKQKALWKDAVLINSMWDSCIMTMTQLDAYFSMLGIFNTIKQKDIDETSINYLVDWLNSIKNNNSLNIRSLDEVSIQPVDAETKLHIGKLKRNFEELNRNIDVELNKLTLFKKSSKK